jgi:uncharacterized protein DUF6653
MRRTPVILSEQTWMRHANPWSVWTRYAALPVLVAAIWSYHALGWWSLAPVAATIVFLIINPRLFSPPRSTRNWSAMAVLGERVWLREGRRFLPEQDPLVFYAMSASSCVSLPALAWGIFTSDLVVMAVCTTCILVGKTWFNDRMVWLFSEKVRTNPEYASWLY